MSAYMTIRSWVDHMLGEGVRSRGILFPAVLPLFLPLLFEQTLTLWIVVAALSGGWLAFVAWRGWRMTKASTIRSDRHYDQSGKFNLAKDYHDSESATAASRSKRNG